MSQEIKEINILRKSLVFMKYDVLAPNEPYIRECDATYPCLYFTYGTNLSYEISQFKKIRG